MLPWILTALLAAALAVRLLKTYLTWKSLDEIVRALGELLSQDTNNLLFSPSRDRRVRRLTSLLNSHLRLLRDQRRRYQNGDRDIWTCWRARRNRRMRNDIWLSSGTGQTLWDS